MRIASELGNEVVMLVLKGLHIFVGVAGEQGLGLLVDGEAFAVAYRAAGQIGDNRVAVRQIGAAPRLLARAARRVRLGQRLGVDCDKYCARIGLGAVYIWYCGGFCAIKQHLLRCKSSQGVQPCCGLRLVSAIF